MKEKKDLICIKLFAGTAIKSENSGVVALSVYYAGKFLNLPPQTLTEEKGEITEHRLLLFGLLYFIRINPQKSIALDYYVTNRSVVFEWNKEHKEDGKFCESTCDRDLWEEITKGVEKNNIRLMIHGTDSPLSGISRKDSMLAKKGKGDPNNV